MQVLRVFSFQWISGRSVYRPVLRYTFLRVYNQWSFYLSVVDNEAVYSKDGKVLRILGISNWYDWVTKQIIIVRRTSGKNDLATHTGLRVIPIRTLFIYLFYSV